MDYRRTQAIPGPVPIHTSIFETTNCVDIRMDLVDADIYVFSPVVRTKSRSSRMCARQRNQ
jgi:hypothetical protein